MKTLTIDDVLAYEPCYTRKRVEELFAGRTEMTIREICAVDVRAKDRVWLVTQDGVLDADMRDKWITIIVTRSITNHALHCGIPEVERWAENWLSGADCSSDAAYVAACAADAAARAAADAAYAAYGAAYAAYAARAAADAAADAAYAAYGAAYAAYAARAAADAADAAYAAAYAAYAANAAARAAYAAADAAYAAARAAADANEREQQVSDLLGLLPE